jgi:PAS domain S-box-containing protein
MLAPPTPAAPSGFVTAPSVIESELYLAIFEHSPDAILLTEPGPAGTIVDANPAACRLFGRPRAFLRGAPASVVVDMNDPRSAAAERRRADTGRFSGSLRMLRADGSRFEGDVSSALFTDGTGGVRACVFIRDITERDLAEKALIASEHRYRSLVETTNTVLVGLAPDGSITEWNEEARSVLGYSRREVLAKNVFDLLFPTKDRAKGMQRFAEVMAGMPLREYEAVVGTRDGRERVLLWNVCRLLDSNGAPIGAIASGQDLTERIRTDENLRSLLMLIENSRDFIGYAALDGHTLYLNAAGLTMVGRRDVADLTLVDFVHECERARIESEVLPALLHAGWWNGETTFRHFETGEAIDVEITSFAVKDSRTGAPRFLAAVARDIRERKQLDQERRALDAKVQHAQKLESLGVLAGGIAHDFNNLLVGILGNASLALMDLDETSPVREAVHDIETTALRAAELTRQMLAYSGRGRFVIKPIDLSTLARELAQLLQTVIAKGAVLRFEFGAEEALVEGDETQLRQIVMNLITNASDAIGTRSGYITLRTGVQYADRECLRSTYIDDELPEGRYAYLEVADTGVGMTPETQARIFDPFFTTKFTGRGLGLAATLGIVRGHRGTIQVQSSHGEGTTFRVLLPCIAKPAPMGAEPAPEARLHGAGTLLVVDDDPTVREVARTMLERRGFSVILAEDGRAALEVFAREGDRISLVLLDLTMPHLSGDETFRLMRAERPDVRGILMSGYSGHELERRFAESGLAGFVQKPFRVEELESCIASALGTG